METKVILTETELTTLKDIQSEIATAYQELGQMEYQLKLLKDSKDRVQKFLEDRTAAQEELTKSLSEKYGEGSVNIETGEFTAFTSYL